MAASNLSSYQRIRDFSRTAEPSMFPPTANLPVSQLLLLLLSDPTMVATELAVILKSTVVAAQLKDNVPHVPLAAV